MFLFSFRYENYFRVYSLIFCVLVLLEFYLLWNWSQRIYPPISEHSFYSFNYIRLTLIILPFLHSSFFYKTQFHTKELKHNLPFLFLCLSIVSIPFQKIIYFSLFILSCLFIKELRILGSGVLASFTVVILLSRNLMSPITPSVYSSVKSNMHKLQGMVETYALDHNGLYPRNTLSLKKAAEEANYWKKIRNPITGKIGSGFSFSDVSRVQLLEMEKESISDKDHSRNKKFSYLLSIFGQKDELAGAVLYYQKNPKEYFIYSSYKDGSKLLFDREKAFFLSNSY